MRNNASCTVKANGGPLQYKVEKLVEISANSGFFTITIRLHGDSGRKWEMGHNTVITGSQTLPPSSTQLAAGGFVFNTDYKSDLFLREFKHVIDYSKVELYDSVGYTGGYDFAKAIKKAPSGQVGGGNATGTADKQAYDNFKWTFGEKGRSSQPHIDITTCPIPWNATPDKIVQAISKVWKNFAIDNFGNIRNPPSGITVDDAQGDNYNKIKQQYMKLNGVIIKPKLAIHIQDVHQAQTQQSANSSAPGTENIYNYTEPTSFGNDTLSMYATQGNQTANISSKIRWSTTAIAGTDDTRTGVWELDGTKAVCPTRRDYNSNTNKSRRQGTANTPGLQGTASIKQAETINCIPYNTQEDRSKFVPRRIRIGFIDTGNFTPSYDNLHVLVNTVPKSQLGGYQRQMTLDANNLNKVGGLVSFAGDIQTDATTGKPTTDAYKAFFNASLSTYFNNGFTLAQSNSNNLNGGIFSYEEDSMININNIANWDTDKILSIGLGDYEDPDKGAGNVYLVQRSKAPDKRENCHSGFGIPADKFYGQNDQIYPDSCLQSRSYVRNESTSTYDSSQWDSHGRFHLANNDIEQHLRDRHNINIIENPQDQTLVFFVFYKEDDINKDYSYNNVEALKLATYWEKLTKQAKGTKEIYMKVNYLTRLFNEGKTMSIKENKLYQTLVMINNYLSSSYRLTRSSRQLNGKVSNLLRDLSNFARKHSGAHETKSPPWQSTAEGIKIIMRGPGSSIQYSNNTGTTIQTLSNPYRDTLNFYSKDLVSSAGNKYTTTGNTLAADLASDTDLYQSYENIKKQAPPGTAIPKLGDIYFDFNALINFLEKDTNETQDNTFLAANSDNRVWGITQGNVTISSNQLPVGAKDGSGYSARDARARPAAWSKDFNICNEELSTSKFAEEMNYRAKLTNVAVAESGSNNPDTHPDFVSAKDTQYLNLLVAKESSLQVMTGKYPARVAAWGGVGTDGTINSTNNDQMYGRAEGAVVSIIASKFIKSGSGAQVVGEKGGVTLTVGSVAGGIPKAEGLSVALAVGDVITVGTATGTVDEVVAAGSGSQTINLTIGGTQGISNLGSSASVGDYVYQVGTVNNVANTIIAAGTLDVAAGPNSATSILKVTLLATSPGSFTSTGTPDLRIATTAQNGATFDDTVVGVIKTNNIQDLSGLTVPQNAARKNLKLLSSVDATGAGGSSVIKITLSAGTFTAAGNPNITVTNAAGTAKAITTETQKVLKLIEVGAGSLGGTLSEAVNLYTTEF